MIPAAPSDLPEITAAPFVWSGVRQEWPPSREQMARERAELRREQARLAGLIAGLSEEQQAVLDRTNPFPTLNAVVVAQQRRIADLLGRIKQLREEQADERWRWSEETMEMPALRGQVKRLEYDLVQARRDVSRALEHGSTRPGTAQPSTEKPGARPSLPPRPLFEPVPEAERFDAPIVTSNPRDRATVPARREEDRRQVAIVLLASTHRELLADELLDIIWRGPLTCEAVSCLHGERPLSDELRAALEARLLPPELALLRADTDPARIRAAFEQLVARERIEILRAELSAAIDEVGDDDAGLERLTSLQAELAMAEARLTAAAMEEI